MSSSQEGDFTQEQVCDEKGCKHQRWGSDDLNVEYLEGMFRRKIYPEYLNVVTQTALSQASQTRCFGQPVCRSQD